MILVIVRHERYPTATLQLKLGELPLVGDTMVFTGGVYGEEELEYRGVVLSRVCFYILANADGDQQLLSKVFLTLGEEQPK